MKIKSITLLIILMLFLIVGAITYEVINNKQNENQFYGFYFEYQKPSELNYEEHTRDLKSITVNVKYFVNDVENKIENIEIFNNINSRKENFNSYLIFKLNKTDALEKTISLSFEVETIVTYSNDSNNVFLTIKSINYNLTGGASEIYTLEFKNSPTNNIYSKVFLNAKII